MAFSSFSSVHATMQRNTKKHAWSPPRGRIAHQEEEPCHTPPRPRTPSPLNVSSRSTSPKHSHLYHIQPYGDEDDSVHSWIPPRKQIQNRRRPSRSPSPTPRTTSPLYYIEPYQESQSMDDDDDDDDDDHSVIHIRDLSPQLRRSPKMVQFASNHTVGSVSIPFPGILKTSQGGGMVQSYRTEDECSVVPRITHAVLCDITSTSVTIKRVQGVHLHYFTIGQYKHKFYPNKTYTLSLPPRTTLDCTLTPYHETGVAGSPYTQLGTVVTLG